MRAEEARETDEAGRGSDSLNLRAFLAGQLRQYGSRLQVGKNREESINRARRRGFRRIADWTTRSAATREIRLCADCSLLFRRSTRAVQHSDRRNHRADRLRRSALKNGSVPKLDEAVPRRRDDLGLQGKTTQVSAVNGKQTRAAMHVCQGSAHRNEARSADAPSRAAATHG